MNEFRKFADDTPQVGDVVQLLDDSGTPDIDKVPITEVIRIVDKTSLSGDAGITPAVSQVWEVRDEQGMAWMVARNPDGDEGGKKGYLQVRIAASEFRKISDESDKELEKGIKVELEHKDTIEKFRKNPEMTDREVAEQIAKDHLKEKKDYYTALKEMESKASLLKESTLANGDRVIVTITYPDKLGNRVLQEGTTGVVDLVGKLYSRIELEDGSFAQVNNNYLRKTESLLKEAGDINPGDRVTQVSDDSLCGVVERVDYNLGIAKVKWDNATYEEVNLSNLKKDMASDIESRLSNPIEDAGTRSHYDLNQSIASLLKEEDSSESTSWYPTIKEALNAVRSMQAKYKMDGFPCDVVQLAYGWYRLEGTRVQPWNFRVKEGKPHHINSTASLLKKSNDKIRHILEAGSVEEADRLERQEIESGFRVEREGLRLFVYEPVGAAFNELLDALPRTHASLLKEEEQRGIICPSCLSGTIKDNGKCNNCGVYYQEEHKTSSVASLLKEEDLETFSRPGTITPGAHVRVNNNAEDFHGMGGTVTRTSYDLGGRLLYHFKSDFDKNLDDLVFYYNELDVDAGIMTSSSLLKEERELDTFEKHQLAIAKKTLQMNDTFARIMGGMTKDEARAIIKRLTGREVKESKTAIQNITYGIDMESGVIVSRMGSEIAWPIMEYEKIGENDDFTKPIKYKLEKFDVVSIAGHIYDNIKWTKNVPVDEKNKHREFWGISSLSPGQAIQDVKQGEQVETRASILKESDEQRKACPKCDWSSGMVLETWPDGSRHWVCRVCRHNEPYQVETRASILKAETTNDDVIRIFLSESFNKEEVNKWGTGNLKIVKEPDGWSLVNYWTRILYRGRAGKVYLNTKKYSATTSKIQRAIQSVARELGVKLIEVEDDSLDESIKKDMTPESSPVETTPENPPLEQPTSGDALWTGRYEPGVGEDSEEPGRHVTVTNASLLKESSFASWWMDNKNSESLYETYENCMKDLGEATGEPKIEFEEWAKEHYKKISQASLLKESGLQNHVMEVLTDAGVAHLVEWDYGKLMLVKKEMGSGSEFAEEVIRALGNSGAFGTVTYDAENNQFNFGIYGEPQEVTITSVLK